MIGMALFVLGGGFGALITSCIWHRSTRQPSVYLYPPADRTEFYVHWNRGDGGGGDLIRMPVSLLGLNGEWCDHLRGPDEGNGATSYTIGCEVRG